MNELRPSLATVNGVLTVTADPQTKVYGNADPTRTFPTRSLGTGAAIVGTLSRNAGENVGTYAITPVS